MSILKIIKMSSSILRRLRLAIVASILAFFLGIIAGFAPEEMQAVIRSDYRMQQISMDEAVQLVMRRNQALTLADCITQVAEVFPGKFVEYYTNNSLVSLISFATGPLAGSFGLCQAFTTGNEIAWEIKKPLAMLIRNGFHGGVEIVAILLSTSGGLYIFFNLITKRSRCLDRTFLLDVGAMFVLSNVLFLIAAVLEAFPSKVLTRYLLN